MRDFAICSACGSTETCDLGDAPDGRLYSCRNCKSLWLDCKIENDPAATLEYGSAYRNGQDTSKAIALHRVFRKLCLLPIPGSDRLLDVGCGDGAFLELAQRDGWQVQGLDSDRRAVETIRLRSGKAIVGCLGGHVDKLGEFDVVTLWDVIEHVADIEYAMNQLARTVAPRGRLVILTPNADCALDSVAHLERNFTFRQSQRMMQLCLNRYHLHRFTLSGLTNLVTRFGFEVESAATLQLYSLNAEKYLSGFAPGISGWTASGSLNRAMSRAAFALVNALRIKNKIFLTCRRAATSTIAPVEEGRFV